MKWKVLLVLLAVILLALVSLSPTGEVDPVLAQGLVDYPLYSDLAMKYHLLTFLPFAWKSEVKGGCVIYKLAQSDEDAETAELIVFPAQDEPGIALAYGKDEVVTVCGDTVHFRYLPASSSQ
jgi:hypothetical protein